MSALADSLGEIPLFSELSARDRKRLAATMQERRLPAGKAVVAEGTRGVGFFVILDGHATVTSHAGTHATLGPGDYFGEMSLIDGDDRTATVTADDELHCATLSTWHFKPFVKDHPEIAWALLRALVARVREAQHGAVLA